MRMWTIHTLFNIISIKDKTLTYPKLCFALNLNM